MKITAKVDVTRLKRKKIRWMKSCREEEKASLKEFSRDFVQFAMQFTPPGDGRTSVGKAHKALKERIQTDFMGYEDNTELSAKHFYWTTTQYGDHYARLKWNNGKAARAQARVSPFYVFKGRPSQKLLKAMGVGKYHVQYLTDLRGIGLSRQNVGGAGYWFHNLNNPTRRKNIHLRWNHVRHVTSRATLLAEIRRRQFLVGHLAAGWKPIALRVGAKLPAAVARHPSHGSATMRHDSRHGAVADITNHSFDPVLQSIVDRNVPKTRKRNRAIAQKRVKQNLVPALRNA